MGLLECFSTRGAKPGRKRGGVGVGGWGGVKNPIKKKNGGEKKKLKERHRVGHSFVGAIIVCIFKALKPELIQKSRGRETEKTAKKKKGGLGGGVTKNKIPSQDPWDDWAWGG